MMRRRKLSGEVRRGAEAQSPAECFRQLGKDLVVRLQVGALVRQQG